MRETILISETVAKESGLDIDHMKRWYASRWNIDIETRVTGRSRTSKPCLHCREEKPLTDFEQLTRKDGSRGQRRSICCECIAAAINAKEAAKSARELKRQLKVEMETLSQQDRAALRKANKQAEKPKLNRQEQAALRAAVKKAQREADRAARKEAARNRKVQCETCDAQRPPADFVDRWGQTRKSCPECRGLCCKPPYGTTTCPGCAQEVHRQEFRMKAPGAISQGRPFRTCLGCRAPKVQ